MLLTVLILEEGDKGQPAVCLCACAGSSRSLISSNGGVKVFSLNNEHTIPGNSSEEERIISFLENRSGLNSDKVKSLQS